MKLRDKVALITGAGSGIGRATAILFAKEGAKVSVVDLDNERGIGTVQLIKDQGGSAIFIRADVSQIEDARRMVEITVNTWNRLDILFNNAGISVVGTVETLTEEEWDRVMGINLKSVFLGSKFAIPHMRRQGGGCIINMASSNGIRPFANRDAYSASKGAIISLTKGMALGFVKDNIRVNCLCPGTVETAILNGVASKLYPDMETARQAFMARQPMGRMGKPEEIAYAALYIASDEAAFMTGSALVIDGGMSL
jgi:NAD(P)-dependent dehydrogenase (short-subunit alcohol dehydrogenase family)